jgi:hypothetical protein
MAILDPQPLVSVLIPAYNHEAYVAQAIRSVIDQTYPNIEIIIIDDASTDGTWGVIQSISEPRLRTLRHENNLGSHATLNEALVMAQGDYLAILNSDDAFLPSRIETCLDALASGPADLVGTDIQLMDDAGQRVESHWWLDAYGALKAAKEDLGDWVATLLAGNVFMTTSNFVFRRAWLEQVGPLGDWRYVLDYEWLLRGCVRDCRLAWLDVPMLKYRLHEGNTISESPLKANLECAALLRQYLPELVADSALGRTRMHALVTQWARIEQYLVQIEDALRHQALVDKEADLFALIQDRDRWIAERDGLIAERDAWIAERDGWIAERDTWIEQRDRAIKDMASAIQVRDGWIAERDTWIEQRDRAIRDMASAIQARDGRILERDTWIEQRDRVIRDMASAIQARDGWVADRDAWIVERDGWIQDRDQWIAERDVVIAELRDSALELELQCDALVRSRAYRVGRLVTAPARWLRDMFNGVSKKS